MTNEQSRKADKAELERRAKEGRLREAAPAYERLRKELAPFIKKRRYHSVSTDGKWQSASCMHQPGT